MIGLGLIMKNYDNVLVSVIVPVFKCENTIQKCIESIVRQTHKNIEIIIVLDGKADNSPQICKDYAQIDDRIKIIEQKNMGLSVARNRGMDSSNGKWLMFVDGDDWIEDTCVKVLLQHAEESKCDIVISGYFVDDGNKIRSCSFFKYKEHYFSEDEKKDTLINCLVNNRVGNNSAMNVGVTWARLYRESFLQKNKLLFVPGLIRMQDAIFNLYAFWYSTLTVLISDNLYHYTVNNKSVSRAYNKDFFNVAIKVLLEIQKFIDVTKNQFLNEAMWDKTILLVYEMIKLQFLPKECTLNRMEKVKRIKMFVENENTPFKENIKKSRGRYLTGKSIIFSYLLKNRFYTIIYLYMEINEKLKNILNI